MAHRPSGRFTSPGLINRRRFLKGATAAGGALAVNGLNPLAALSQSSSLPSPEASGIEHIVLVMMENRSFDHFLGWMDGADGRQRGLVYRDASGVPHPTYRLAPDYQGCGHADPDHSYEGGRVEYDQGACDGWLRAGSNDLFSIGFYTKKDLPFLGSAATQWTTCDRYFAAIMAPTFPNRIYQHAAQTDRLSNTFELALLPTIWDRLADAGLEGRYYFSDVPFLGLWGDEYLSISRPTAAFLADAAAGTLPHVSFIDPIFLGETIGVSNDDHPFADIRNGEALLNLLYSAVTTSPAWSKTVMIISFDEWGGFFDHVPPTAAPIPRADELAGNKDGLRGFRTPCIVISPFARREAVSSLLLDHTSVLRMIEWRWGLPSLTVRDASANNLAEVLDFSSPRLRAKQFDVPIGPFGAPCPGESSLLSPQREEWAPQLQIAADFGWPVQAVKR